MVLLSHLFFLHLLFLVSIANIELPVKHFIDGSKSSFVQAPYISSARDQTVKEIQEQITNSWPEGIITYYLDDKSYDSSIGVRIRTAMSVLEVAACIRFRVEKTKPERNMSWIHITNPNKKRQCMHETTVVDKGEIILILGYDCLQKEELIHSLLHGVGFKDEITHPHRDKYIRVLWDNIQPVYRNLYRIQPAETSRSIVEYDPLSIMHFHDRAFSSNGKATIVPLESGLIISPSDSLSQLDKMRIQLYFGHECNKRKFSSLIETCKKSLKGENEIEPENHDTSVAEENLSEDQEASAHDTKENEASNPNTEENLEPVDIKENETSNPNTEENVEPVDIKENENSDGNVEPTKNKENEEVKETPDENNVSGSVQEIQEKIENSEEKTVFEGMKKNEDEKENPEENAVSVNKDEEENLKLDNESENSTLSPRIVLTGKPHPPIDNSINEGFKNTMTNNQNKGEPGINLDYETAYK